MNHILSARDFSKESVEKVLTRAKELESAYHAGTLPKLLENKIVASIFFEPSTRTRLSFETAVLRLGGQVISAENAGGSSSAYKGETIEDTARILSSYVDLIVMRHPEAGSVQRAATVATKPVLNAGDGANQHPSQALLDLYTIQKEHGTLEGLSIVCIGDLLYSRTLHSLVPLLLEYPNNSFHFVSPAELAIPQEYKDMIIKMGGTFTESMDLPSALTGADVVYMTRVQKERFSNMDDYERVKDLFILKSEHLTTMKDSAIIMHPLPRVGEIDPAIDLDARAAYFRQAENGLYVRMALLVHALGL